MGTKDWIAIKFEKQEAAHCNLKPEITEKFNLANDEEKSESEKQRAVRQRYGIMGMFWEWSKSVVVKQRKGDLGETNFMLGILVWLLDLSKFIKPFSSATAGCSGIFYALAQRITRAMKGPSTYYNIAGEISYSWNILHRNILSRILTCCFHLGRCK